MLFYLGIAFCVAFARCSPTTPPPQVNHAQRHAILIGGSGEDRQPENFFQPDFEQMRQTLEARDWTVTVFFSGRKHRLEKSQPAEAKLLDTFRRRIEKETAPGTQLLFIVHAHGSQRWPEWETTHSIGIEDEQSYSLDPWVDTLQALWNRGVEVAAVDLSCYSGASLPSPSDSNRFCRVSLATDDYVSICSGQDTTQGFVAAFTHLPKRHLSLSLEEHFLQSRLADATAENFPQISSIPSPGRWEWNEWITGIDPSAIDLLDAADSDLGKSDRACLHPQLWAQSVVDGWEHDTAFADSDQTENLSQALQAAAIARDRLDHERFHVKKKEQLAPAADELIHAGSIVMAHERAAYESFARRLRQEAPPSTCARFSL